MGASNFARGNTSKVFAVLIELIEEVFTKVSQPLNVVASFSNGETIYQKV